MRKPRHIATAASLQNSEAYDPPSGQEAPKAHSSEDYSKTNLTGSSQGITEYIILR